MAEIETGASLVTLINIFTVQPESQQALIDLLVEVTETVTRHQPGFVSSSLHKSLDGRKVVNYGQWRTMDDYRAVLQNSDARAHILRATELADSVEPGLYDVVYTAGA
jgi:heme-degrading monooxygenase HmoA